MSTQAHVVPLGTLLQALAEEIDAPRRAMLLAEHHLAGVLRSANGIDDATQDLQNIDLALQILNDLEGFILRLKDCASSDQLVDVGPGLKGLTLERLSTSLGAAFGATVSPLSTQPSIELF
jgi:hypothetical protein